LRKSDLSPTADNWGVALRQPAEQSVRGRRSRSLGPTQEERTAEARARIIEAAFACLAEVGYQRTTLAEIANKASCSRELPRYHFGTKDRLMEVLIDESRVFWIATFRKQLKNNTTGLEALYNIVDTFSEALKQNSPRLRGLAVLLFIAADPGNRALRKLVVAIQRATRAAFGDIIAQHLEAHPELAPYDVDGVAAMVYCFFRGFVYQWMTDPQPIVLEAMFREFKLRCPQLLGVRPSKA
jgi:AcrR family transcriptional regulator